MHGGQRLRRATIQRMEEGTVVEAVKMSSVCCRNNCQFFVKVLIFFLFKYSRVDDFGIQLENAFALRQCGFNWPVYGIIIPSWI